MKRAIVLLSYPAIIFITVITISYWLDTRAALRTKGYWSEVRMLQSCAADFYKNNNKVPIDLTELAKWGMKNEYQFDSNMPDYGFHVSYIRISDDSCGFINISYGSLGIASFSDYKNNLRRDIESLSNGKVRDLGWQENKY